MDMTNVAKTKMEFTMAAVTHPVSTSWTVDSVGGEGEQTLEWNHLE
jgi:hypothetical protein